jgi:hypothetical protein
MVRSPMQVDPLFHEKMKELQKKIMKKKGEFKGFPKIQKEMIKLPEWSVMEKKILGEINQIKFKINFDGRNK